MNDNKEIIKLQKFLYQNKPLGIDYKLKPSSLGVIDNALKKAIKELERKIAKEINNIAVNGIIMGSDNKLRTTAEDVSNSVRIIEGIKRSKIAKAQATVDVLDGLHQEEKKVPLSLINTLDKDVSESFSPSDDQNVGREINKFPKIKKMFCRYCYENLYEDEKCNCRL